MARYTVFFFGIVLSLVMSIFIGSPVYCEDGPTQDIATTATEHKSSISTSAGDINQKSDASTTSPILDSPVPMQFKQIIEDYGVVTGTIVTSGVLLGNVFIDKHFPTGVQLKNPFIGSLAGVGLRVGLVTMATAVVGAITAGTFKGVMIVGEHYNRTALVGPNSNSNLTIPRGQAQTINFANQSDSTAIQKYVDTTGPNTNLQDKAYLVSKYREDSAAAAASNQNTVTSTDNVNHSHKVPCIIEEGETTTFVQSCNNFVVDWLHFNYGNRVPANLSGNLLDYFSFDFSFTSLNLSIIFMHTLVYWLFLFLFTLLSLKYFSSKLTSWLNKTTKMSAAVVQFFISINILVVIFLFIVILIFSVYIYFYCNIPQDVAHHINNTMKILLDKTTDITITNTFLGVDSRHYMKLSGTVGLCILGIYRTYVVIRPLYLSTTIASCFVLFVLYTVKVTYTFITKITTMGSDSEPSTLLELFGRYNDSNHVLFYSMIIIILSVTVTTTISYYKKYMVVTDNDQCNADNNKIGNSNKHLVYEILVAYNKVITSMAFYCAFQSIVFLHVYSIPGYIDHYLTLY